jgi:hypothetical protein
MQLVFALVFARQDFLRQFGPVWNRACSLGAVSPKASAREILSVPEQGGGEMILSH